MSKKEQEKARMNLMEANAEIKNLTRIFDDGFQYDDKNHG